MSAELKREERFPASVSVGIIPYYDKFSSRGKGIVLGERAEDGLISPVAGGMKKGEEPLAALEREWVEETTLPFSVIKLSSTHPTTIISTGPDKISVGLLYIGHIDGDLDFPYFPENAEMKRLDFYGAKELKELLDNFETKLFRPDLNLVELRGFLRDLEYQDDMTYYL